MRIIENSSAEDFNVGHLEGSSSRCLARHGTWNAESLATLNRCPSGGKTTATWDPASVPAGQSSPRPSLWAGARLETSHTVEATSRSLGAAHRLRLGGETVTVVLANPTTAAVDLGSMTLSSVSRVK